jgi:hypothetical protein
MLSRGLALRNPLLIFGEFMDGGLRLRASILLNLFNEDRR